ncbi:hypothetical protein AVEN_236174-1, partial [Araneus ventricosus]
HIAWRKEMGIDTILTDYEPPEVLLKYIPVCLMCFNKAGCIVRMHDCGRVDSKVYRPALSHPTGAKKNTELFRSNESSFPKRKRSEETWAPFAENVILKCVSLPEP